MTETAQVAVKEFIPIDLHSLRIDSILDFHLYIKVDNEHVLFRAPSLPFADKTRRKLIEKGVNRLYISGEERKAYHAYIESHLNEIISDETVDETSKSAIIYDSATMLVRDLIEKPSLPKNMRRSLALVQSTTLYLLKTQSAFHSMLGAMSFDYSMYTHSVNVCTYSIALAHKIGIEKKEKLFHLGTGALLHDIGKSRIPAEILEKDGVLNEAEMEIMRRHPEYGFEIVKNSEVIHHDSHYSILQHHERQNGSGYPYGLTSQKLHKYSKITAIADVFDALTTRRSYRDAKDAFPALSEMYADAELYDTALLKAFTLLLGPSEKVSSE